MKIFLGHFHAQIGTEVIFKLKNWERRCIWK